IYSSNVTDSTLVSPDSLRTVDTLPWNIPENIDELMGPQPQIDESIGIEMPVYPEPREEEPLPEQNPESPAEPSTPAQDPDSSLEPNAPEPSPEPPMEPSTEE
ncbi:MAG TPA: hypothetical protein PLX59_04950, partial [Candidatus Cloacimonadota bacterium]|nr:hypothetical protein [Candidatus Cloacimonadota bacterium]